MLLNRNIMAAFSLFEQRAGLGLLQHFPLIQTIQSLIII